MIKLHFEIIDALIKGLSKEITLSELNNVLKFDCNKRRKKIEY